MAALELEPLRQQLTRTDKVDLLDPQDKSAQPSQGLHHRYPVAHQFDPREVLPIHREKRHVVALPTCVKIDQEIGTFEYFGEDVMCQT